MDTEYYHINLNYLNSFQEKFGIKANYANFKELDVEKDFKFQKFINSCIIKKTHRNHKIGKTNLKLPSLISKNTNKEFIDLNTVEQKIIKGENEIRDMSASPKTKRDTCIIY